MAFVVNFINTWSDKFFERIEPAIRQPSKQKKLVLVVVSIALLLDNMLYMVIVPIIPDFLQSIGAWGPPTWTRKIFNHTVIHEQKLNATIFRRYNTTDTGFKWLMVNRAAQDSAIGVLFASKAILQLIVNPFTGALIDRIGYDIPMMIGLSIIFVSTCIFALGESYGVLFFARSLQGIGSAFADTGGLSMIADRFQQEGERTQALGIALAFISFGYIVAPPFGGILYEYLGKEVPFMILACVALADGILMMIVMKPVREERALQHAKQDLPKGTPIWRLFMDPYILLVSGALIMANTSLAFLEPTIAIWMESNLHASESEIGLVWLPAFFPHVLGVYVTVRLAKGYPQYMWLIAAVGLTVQGLSCIMIPFVSKFWAMVIPLSIICFGAALVDTALLPTLGYLVDIRHSSVYGSIYAIADISYSFAYAVGPVVAGAAIKSIGFSGLNFAIMFSNVAFAPLLYFLWKVQAYRPFEENGKQQIGMDAQENSYGDGAPYPTEPGYQTELDYQPEEQGYVPEGYQAAYAPVDSGQQLPPKWQGINAEAQPLSQTPPGYGY